MNSFNASGDRSQEVSKSRMVRKIDKTGNQLNAECPEFAQKRRYDLIEERICWELCRKFGFRVKEK